MEHYHPVRGLHQHTVLAEALERWPQNLFEHFLPRIWQITQEIAARWQKKVEDFFHDPQKTEKMAIIWGGEFGWRTCA